ncbi:MAG: UDP-N-acetylmuramoyl-L-alanine--D-glutamate ligase [Polyangiaceae bacterium]|nr:UDP-N-acetylmuramoyl-L-alanine--D-glutamate ligase [Polyangiaceae bacterium]
MSDLKKSKPQELTGKKCLVVGLGTSGRSACELLLREGARVTATDSRPLEALDPEVVDLDVRLAVGGHDTVDFLSPDLIVVSPGVPSFPRLEAAVAAGVEVIGETELAARFLRAPLFVVGGTNGKSTATTLLGHLMAVKNPRVFVGGNLGEPACDAPLQGPDIAILEVSSFQMERLRHFRPEIALLLNISEDHLDRYADFEEYVRAKGNCFENQQPADVAIFPYGDALCEEQVNRGKARKITFGSGGDYFVEGHDVVERATGVRFNLESVDLYGGHNYLNAAAAIAAARAHGVSAGDIEEGLRRFRALRHRMALSGRYNGVPFYDDSKATNVGAAVKALLNLSEEKGILIAGGKDKMGSFEPLIAAIAQKARAVVLIGEASSRLATAIGARVPVERSRSLQDAVVRAYRLAELGDAVLLSPACSSFDMFKNYSERGERFTQAVQALPRLLKEDEV